MKKAFTLVEMLVVIAIIGILAGVLMGVFSGSTESAHTARCLSNLKNLASACHSASVAIGHIPPAGSFEIISSYVSNGKGKKQYFPCDGWISWSSSGKYTKDSNNRWPSSHQSCSYVSMYTEGQEDREYALTNGVLWKYVNGNHNTYLCPQHERAKKALKPNFSYVMNSYFGWDYSKGSRPISVDNANGIVKNASMSHADKILLFAEIPFVEHDGLTISESTSGEECDSVLQYASGANSIKLKSGSSGTSNEAIGFNHKNGKQYFANIVFADGHTEKLVYPKTGMSEGEIKNLTYWLCNGSDVSFDGKKYELQNN